MLQYDVFSSINDSFLFGFLAMLNDGINKSTRISTCKNKAHFTNNTMHYICTLLLKFICKNRQLSDVAMLNQRFSILTVYCIIERTVCIDTLVPVFKESMTENVGRLVMSVVPDQRNDLSIAFLESIFQDSSSIRATDIIPSRPSGKIICHFEFPPSFSLHLNRSIVFQFPFSIRLCCCF